MSPINTIADHHHSPTRCSFLLDPLVRRRDKDPVTNAEATQALADSASSSRGRAARLHARPGRHAGPERPPRPVVDMAVALRYGARAPRRAIATRVDPQVPQSTSSSTTRCRSTPSETAPPTSADIEHQYARNSASAAALPALRPERVRDLPGRLAAGHADRPPGGPRRPRHRS